jgi:CheY-like chemotaxis protein
MSSQILVIDDEDLFREDLAKLLRRKGYECRTACDGEQGLALLEQFDPEVILCDIVMPDCNGLDVLERLYAIRP